MNKRAFLGAALLASVLGATGCAGNHVISTNSLEDSEVVQRTSAGTDALAALLKARGAGKAPIVVASIVDLDTLEATNFGRSQSEQVAARLAHIGLPVVELKMRSTLYMGKSGEYLLSRELKDVSAQHQASIAVVGTYAVASSDVLVTLKAVDIANNTVVAAHTYSVPKGLVRRMLQLKPAA